MVTVILTGGLGNQMFEYAAAKALAIKLEKEIRLDLYALNKQTQGTKRNLELDIFDIKTKISTSFKSKTIVKGHPFFEKRREFFQRQLNYFRDGSAIVYDKRFEKLESNTTLYGHFQNEKYFQEYRDIIKKEFTFPIPLLERNLRLAEKIENSNSVSIHIRRGDYISNTKAKNNFSICSSEYYAKSIAEIKKNIENPSFFIFSEDFEWAKENLTFGDSSIEFIDWNKEKESYIDMQLMSICKHNIIANSSFSWWAAWLNEYKNKRVYAPSQWFIEEIRNKDLADFYPKEWQII